MTAPSRLLLLGAFALSVSACDVTETYIEETRATVVDFTLDGDRYVVSDDTRVASFDTDDVVGSEDRADLQTALRTAGDGAVVVAYIKTELVLGSGTSQTYSALPISRAVEGGTVTLPDGTVVPTVEFTLGYEYSFDNEDFYLDVVSSTRGDAFTGGARSFFDFYVPQDIDLRVVTLPADRLSKSGVDLSDYAAVAAAFGLPE